MRCGANEDRTNGPGFADRLRGVSDAPYAGEDGLRLDRESARSVWTRVLSDNIKQHGGRCCADERAGRMGWFHLRLTCRETMDLFSAAEADGLIEEIAAPAGDADHGEWTLTSQKMSVEWRLTPDGRKLTALRGSGLRDTFRRLPRLARQLYGVAQLLLGATVASLATAIGFQVKGHSALALALAVGGAWSFVIAVVVRFWVLPVDE